MSQRNAYEHHLLAPLAARLRKLGAPGYAAYARDLASLGGELCSCGLAPRVFEFLIGEIERLTREAGQRDMATGRADLVAALDEARAEIDVLKTKLGGSQV